VIAREVRRGGILFAVLVGAALLVGPARAATVRTDYATEVFNLINAERVRLSLPPFVSVPGAALTAELHGRDMADRDYFSHYTAASSTAIIPDPVGYPSIRFTGGMNPGGRLVACGFSDANRGWGENIAWNWGYGSQSPQVAVNGWFKSPGHYGNITNPSFKGMGIGAVQAADGGVYYCQVFTVSTTGAQTVTSPPPPSTATSPSPTATSPTDTTTSPTPADTTAPGSWTGLSPYTSSESYPTCTIQVIDAESGLDVATAEYRFSTDGGWTWSTWRPASCTGSTGTTASETISAYTVPFGQASTRNRVQFRIRNRANLTGTSATYRVSPPRSW
jgi:uncharacterized protein YkwD